MYTIIGGDGKEYGPESADQIRRWIADGRANLATRAKAAGTDVWKRLDEFPEFVPGHSEVRMPAFDAEAGVAPAAARAVSVTPREFSPLDCFGRSWDLLRANFWPVVGAAAILILLQIAASELIGVWAQTEFDPAHPLAYFSSARFQLGQLEEVLIGAPLTAGFKYYFLKLIRGQKASVGEIFAGFSGAFLPIVLAVLVSSFLIGVGLLCLLLPGIYLAVAYGFATLFVIDRKLGVWTALEASRQMITRHWWSIFLMCIIGGLLVVVGFLALGVGLFVAVPLVIGAFVYAYEELSGRPIPTDPEPVNSALPTA